MPTGQKNCSQVIMLLRISANSIYHYLTVPLKRLCRETHFSHPSNSLQKVQCLCFNNLNITHSPNSFCYNKLTFVISDTDTNTIFILVCVNNCINVALQHPKSWLLGFLLSTITSFFNCNNLNICYWN